ncbi:uncharacterized protein LOC111867506 [Cryptotermes secundus]|uniref:uncharacterized protein LOC111867506 n=1 Tax=Cryptotermes secundus TaxID=105785 RepID=UPI000CD7BE60|nr:uncharacterized protein LOC111867506 [Cryptotermes secundus]
MEARRTGCFVAQAILLIFASQALCETVLDDAVTPASTEITVTVPAAVEPGTCSETGNTCYNCSSAPFCVPLADGDFLNAGPYNCADADPSKPYCTDGACSASASSECSPDAPESEFLCTDDGYFPDPNDCQKFHFCIGSTSTTFTCSENFVYSHEKVSCIRRRASSDCAVIKCTYKTQFQYVIYPKDPNVYGLCVRDSPTIVLKCAEGEEFDIKTSKCTFICKKEGLFPVKGDSRKYRECISISSNKYQLVDRECPVGSKFDSDKERCVIVSET